MMISDCEIETPTSSGEVRKRDEPGARFTRVLGVGRSRTTNAVDG